MIKAEEVFFNMHNPDCVIHVVMDNIWDENIQQPIYRVIANDAVIHWGVSEDYIIQRYSNYLKYLGAKGYITEKLKRFIKSIQEELHD